MNCTVYYRDEHVLIRSMKEADIQIISAGFAAQGWEKPVEVLEDYYHAQQNVKNTFVFIAEWDGQVAGYTVLYPEAHSGPYAGKGIPYISDFNVFIACQRRGIGWKIMDAAERKAFEMASSVCLGVGLHYGYGSAQRMYAKRGYIPDGSGVWYMNQRHEQYAPCVNDDDLILYMEKVRPE